MRTICFILVGFCLGTSAIRNRRAFDDDGEEVDNSGCDAGQVKFGDSCLNCQPGLYANTATQICDACPFDTYSDKERSVECTECPGGGKTASIGAQSKEWCMIDVCIIPASSKSYYEKSSDQTLLNPSDRVQPGEEITFLCLESHTIIDTSYSYLSITCTVSTADSLPHTCVNANEPNEVNGLICYDDCYKETFESTTRYVKVVNGGSVNVESCPVAQCQGQNDTCVTVSYTSEEEVDVTHYSCQLSSLFDNEICKASSAEGNCEVERCASQRCNKPRSGAVTSTLYFTVAVMFLRVFW